MHPSFPFFGWWRSANQLADSTADADKGSCSHSLLDSLTLTVRGRPARCPCLACHPPRLPGRRSQCRFACRSYEASPCNETAKTAKCVAEEAPTLFTFFLFYLLVSCPCRPRYVFWNMHEWWSFPSACLNIVVVVLFFSSSYFLSVAFGRYSSLPTGHQSRSQISNLALPGAPSRVFRITSGGLKGDRRGQRGDGRSKDER